ncbi:NmrA family NAD(P)-binding protein [Streptomyces tendae]|uniref:NmrA family NAD(P)-binding protein n=1 Tax=Streptomyces tendae TaxID=1932 RepID=UPI0036BDBF33
MILIIGATGTIGSLLARRLAEGEVPFRALVRRKDVSIESAETIVADLDEPSSLRDAFTGIDQVFLNTAGTSTDEGPVIAQQTAAIDAAVAAGAEHIIKVSAQGTAPDLPIPFGMHANIEGYLAASGIAATVLRPSSFMQNLIGGITTFTEEGELYDTYCGGAAAYVDARDIADCAYAVLTGRVRRGGVHTLTGPQALTAAEVASALSTALNRPVGAVQPTYKELEAMYQQLGLAQRFAQQLTAMAKVIAAGRIADVTTAVRDLTGNAPRSLETFITDHREALEKIVPIRQP